MSDTIENLWRDIVNLLAKVAPARARELAAGASAEQLDELEAKLGRKLPIDYRASLSTHNGYASLSEFTYLDAGAVFDLWEAMHEDLATGRFEGLVVDNSGDNRIRSVWWHNDMIPFCQDSGGALLCIDLAPGSHGRAEQIVLHERDAGPVVTPFASFGDWLQNYCDALVKGDFKISAEGYLRDVGR